jgi:hypothetical protein
LESGTARTKNSHHPIVEWGRVNRTRGDSDFASAAAVSTIPSVSSANAELIGVNPWTSSRGSETGLREIGRKRQSAARHVSWPRQHRWNRRHSSRRTRPAAARRDLNYRRLSQLPVSASMRSREAHSNPGSSPKTRSRGRRRRETHGGARRDPPHSRHGLTIRTSWRHPRPCAGG